MSDNGGCRKALAIGCGVVGLLVVIAVIAVAVNWDRITSVVEQVKEAAEDLSTLQGDLQEEYPAEGLTIQTRNADLPVVEIEFTNPEFTPSEDKAREIVRFIHERFPDQEFFDAFDIVFRETQPGGASTRSTSHRILLEDLIGAPEDGP